jgi:pyrimidine-nucleoside phosphorylase
VSRFLNNLAKHSIVVAGQTPDLVPADGKLYALRDVTATVGSYPLIASSIMSKKLAVGASSIVLDVKVGRGAFMETEAEAVELAHVMIELAENLGKRSAAVISDMNQPLGLAVGNSLEVKEAIDTLRGVGPDDFTSHCLTIGTQMLLLTGQSKNESEACTRLQELLLSGLALDRFKDLVEAQDGDSGPIDDVSLLPRAGFVRSVPSPTAGHISRLDARTVGLAAMDLGAGRRKKGDPVDHAVGIVLHRKIGDRVDLGEDLCTIHAQTEDAAQRAQESILNAYEWQDHAAEPPPLVYRVVR